MKVNGVNGHASRWVVPDEAMLTRLADDFMRQLAGERQEEGQARLTSDLTDLPVSTTEGDLVEPGQTAHALRARPARTPAPAPAPAPTPAPASAASPSL